MAARSSVPSPSMAPESIWPLFVKDGGTAYMTMDVAALRI
jgi:hypothetical protein